MTTQVRVGRDALSEEVVEDGLHIVAADLAYQRLGIVNVVYFGEAGAGDGGWVLIDAGVFGTAGLIRNAVSRRFGGSRPAAIVMTHGHFDHVGALRELAEEWDVPIYAHSLELPYLDGRSSYPPPDPSVAGGMMARLSPMYPRGPVDVQQWLQTLPADNSVPHMPGWCWMHTPGHTEGHVSLWRVADRTLIAGDALITTNQESAYAVATQAPEIHGPPMYLTQDWKKARTSVERLASLEPRLLISGHGRALEGDDMRRGLHRLAEEFDAIAIPAQGRYVDNPVLADETGITYVPPKREG